MADNYFHAMDQNGKDEPIKLNPDYIGISTPPFQDQLESLKTRIFQGAKHVELGFTGSGKGNMQQGSTTPEMYGKEQRQNIRHLAKLNDVTLSTHATVGVSGLSGRTEQGFVPEAQEQALNEIKRAVDFAADTTDGGSITFHTGEFPRPVSNYKKEGFEGHFSDEERGQITLADEETGEIMNLRKDTPISRPKFEYTDKEKTIIKKDKYKYDVYERNEDGEIEFETVTYKKLEDEARAEAKRDGKEFIEGETYNGVKFYKKYLEQQKELYRADAMRWRSQIKGAVQRRKDFEEIEERYSERRNQPGVNRDKIDGEIVQSLKERGLYPSPDVLKQLPERGIDVQENPLAFLQEQLKEMRAEEKVYDDMSLSQGRQLADTERKIQNVKDIADVGVKRSTDGIARAAIYAYNKEKEQKLDNPLFIAPENIWPDTGYGSHPDELKDLIVKSRDRMVTRLREKDLQKITGQESDKGKKNPDYDGKLTDTKAKKIAEDRIRATFDIGHANIWRKYFKGSDKDFDKWMIKKVEGLNKAKAIGHVHLTDNFGFDDEHLTPGEGNAPFGPFIKKMQEGGYKGPMIIEPGHQDIQAMVGGMKHFHSPVYRSRTWGDVKDSYLTGGGMRPNYVVGKYSPDAGMPEDQRAFSFWSGVQIE